MKKIRLLSLLGLVLVAGTLTGCLDNIYNDTGNEANQDIIIEDITDSMDAVIDYNDTLVDLAYNCISSEDAVWTAYNSDVLDIESINSAIDNTVNVCNSAIKEIEALGDWEGDSSLKDNVIALLGIYVKYYEKVKEYVPYLENENNLTEEQAKISDSLIAEIDALNSEIESANENLILIQDQFANNHGFELQDINEGEEVDEEVTEEIVEE